MPVQLNNSHIQFLDSVSSNAHMMIGSGNTNEHKIKIEKQQSDGRVETIKVMDFGSVDGKTLNMSNFASIGDKILIGHGSGNATISHNDQFYKKEYGVLDFIEGLNSTDGYFEMSNTLRVPELVALSDIRLKSNIEIIQNACSNLQKINGYRYTWKKNGQATYGLIAQEVESIFPEVVSQANDIKTLNYSAIIPFLVEAVKDMSNQIGTLNLKIDSLQDRLVSKSSPQISS
mgnify:CR=1 FL=1